MHDDEMEDDEIPIADHSRGKHDLSLNYSALFNSHALLHVGNRKITVIKFVGKGANLRCDYSDPQLAIQSPSAT